MSNTPTDAEIVAVMRDGYNCRYNDEQDHIDFARAVLEKWSTPQPVVREPLTDEQIDDLIAAKHFRAGYELTASDKVCINWYRLGLRDGERAHGITQKGGQHGAE